MTQKLRIVKTTICDGQFTVFVVQRKPWWSPKWLTIRGYYQSDFIDMPGWWAEHMNSEEDAMKVLLAYKSGKLSKTRPDEVIYEE
jgi:hypothetical protein